jgi:hypothetical protein
MPLSMESESGLPDLETAVRTLGCSASIVVCNALVVPPVSDALPRLRGALADIGLRAPAPPDSKSAIAELAAAVSPWRLPPELVAFWSVVDGPTLPVRAYFLEPHGPKMALEFWREIDIYQQPMNLALLAYSSQWCAAVELDTEHAAGGTVWMWYMVDGDFHLWARSVGEWLDIQAEAVEQGAYTIKLDGWREDLYDAASISLDAYRELFAQRLGLSDAEQILTTGREPEDWPSHWAIHRPT